MDTSELWKEPSFSVLCSFFNKFGSALGIKPLSFRRLESVLTFDKEGRSKFNAKLMLLAMAREFS